MIFECAPAAFNGVVLAVIGRVVDKSNIDLILLHKLDDSFEKLCSAATIFRPIVLQKDKTIHIWKRGLLLRPPLLYAVNDAITGRFGRCHENIQSIMVGQKNANWGHFLVRRKIVVEGPGDDARFAFSRKVPDLDDRLRIDGYK